MGNNSGKLNSLKKILLSFIHSKDLANRLTILKKIPPLVLSDEGFKTYLNYHIPAKERRLLDSSILEQITELKKIRPMEEWFEVKPGEVFEYPDIGHSPDPFKEPELSYLILELYNSIVDILKKIADPQISIVNDGNRPDVNDGEEDQFMVDEGGIYRFPKFGYSVKKTRPGQTMFLIITNPRCKEGIDPKTLFPSDDSAAKGTLQDLHGDNDEEIINEISYDTKIQKVIDGAKNEREFTQLKKTLIEKKRELESQRESGEITDEDTEKLSVLKKIDDMTWRGARSKTFTTRETNLIKHIRNDIDRFIAAIRTEKKEYKELKNYLQKNKPKIKNGLIFYSGNS